MTAWICALLTTDRDLESSSTMKKVNAWICEPTTADHDPASVIPDKKRKSVTTVIFTDLMLFELISPVTKFPVIFWRAKLFFELTNGLHL